MSRIVAALERAELVERVADEADGRVQWIHITPNGKTVLERGRGRRIEQLALLLRGLPASEIALLERAAEVIEDVLRK
jgi:DNA-binding MarR family transcriptional regulator